MHGASEKGSFRDRLRSRFHRRKKVQLLADEQFQEQLEERKLEADLKKKQELQLILIRNRFLEQSVDLFSSPKRLPVSDMKMKVVMASQVVMAGMGLVAMGLSGKVVDDKKGQSLFDQGDNVSDLEISKKDDDLVKDVSSLKESSNVLKSNLVSAEEKDYVVSSDTVDVVSHGQMQLGKIDEKFQTLDESLDQSLYQREVASIEEKHEVEKPVLKQVEDDFQAVKNTVLDQDLSHHFSDVKEKDVVTPIVPSSFSTVVVFGNRDFSKLKLVKDHSHSLEQRTGEKQQRFERRDQKFQKSRKRTLQVDDLNYQLSSELARQTQYLNALQDRIAFADRNYDLNFKLKATGSLLGNIFKLSMGILTLPFHSQKKSGSRLLIGSVLIHHALKGLKTNIFGDKNYRIYQEYRAFLREISEGKNELEVVQILLSDSLSDVRVIREEFISMFQECIGKMPEYDEVLEKINKIEESLLKKQEVVGSMENNLNREYERNKVKVKKMEGA